MLYFRFLLISTLTFSSLAMADETITLLSASGGATTATMIVGPADAEFPAALVASDFTNADAGVPAIVELTPNGAWLPALAAPNAAAQWIGTQADPSAAGDTGLFSLPFTVTETEIGTATVTFRFVTDNTLGGANNQGLFINGTALAGTTGGNFGAETVIGPIDITSLVSTGTNRLYVNNTDLGGPGAIIFAAEIHVTTAPSIPTLSVYGLGLMIGLLGLFGLKRRRG